MTNAHALPDLAPAAPLPAVPLPALPSGVALPGDEHYARNLIGGRWQFPAAPFEFEIRNPLDSTVSTVVPLSSRFDVARAVTAARAATRPWSSDGDMRHRLLTQLVDRLEFLAGPLAQLQSLETGLASADSRAAVAAVTRLARILLATRARDAEDAEDAGHEPVGRVGGHILSWGLPFAEVVCSVLPDLLAGRTVVVKPSLRAPMSAVAFAHLATHLGFPPGVINIVQGTGVDTGAALASTHDLAALHVRAGDRTLDQAARAVKVTGARLHCLRAGGNVVLAGRGADPDRVAAAVTDALRVHSTGGLLNLPLLSVQAEAAGQVVDAVLARLPGCPAAPLPTEPLRTRALSQVAALQAAGARVLRGGTVPDDAAHRMGWLLPSTVVTAGAMRGGAGSHSRGTAAGESLGPVLTVVTWRSPAELAGTLPHPRYADAIACVWGLDDDELAAAGLPQAVILQEATPMTALHDALLPAAWMGGYASGPGEPSDLGW
jgi:acyl-CoA reductase-like NAD-dependent aldehyde dehydrogenase